MGKWTECYGNSVSVKGGWTSTHVAEIHNTDCDAYEARIAALEAELKTESKWLAECQKQRDEAAGRIARIVAMLEPGSGQLGHVEDEKTMSLTLAEWNILEQAHARAIAIAEGRGNSSAEQSAAAINAMVNDPGDTPETWISKLKALRGKECTYGNVAFSQCCYYQSELARAVAIAEGREPNDADS